MFYLSSAIQNEVLFCVAVGGRRVVHIQGIDINVRARAPRGGWSRRVRSRRSHAGSSTRATREAVCDYSTLLCVLKYSILHNIHLLKK